MRPAIALLILAACTEHGKGGGDPTRPDPPADCLSHCIIDHPVMSLEDCCDSVTCFFNEDTNEWEKVFCDAPPPLPPDPCEQCGSTELCVQSYDGTCNETTACVPRTVDCPNNACSTECEQTYCSSPFQCMNRVPCGTESPLSFTCYGP